MEKEEASKPISKQANKQRSSFLLSVVYVLIYVGLPIEEESYFPSKDFVKGDILHKISLW
jgi:hypothetical protein